MTKIENINNYELPNGCTVTLGNGKTSLKGGELKESYKINVTLDLSGVKIATVLNEFAKSSSPLVRWQSAQRGTATRAGARHETLKELEQTGVTVHLNDIDKTMKTDADRRAEALEAVKAMSPEQKALFIEALTAAEK